MGSPKQGTLGIYQVSGISTPSICLAWSWGGRLVSSSHVLHFRTASRVSGRCAVHGVGLLESSSELTNTSSQYDTVSMFMCIYTERTVVACT